MLLGTVSSNAYRIVLALHIIAAVVGFGSVLLNGVYASKAMARRGPEGAAIAQANYEVSFGWAQWFIYAILILGFALVGMSDKLIKFSQTWIWLSIVLYLAIIGIVNGVHRTNVRRLNELMREGNAANVDEMERRGRRAEAMGALMTVLFVIIVFLMVMKPGGPKI